MTDNPILTLEEAAEYIDMSVEDLRMSFYRGLPPGNLGFNDIPGRLVFNKADLLPPPREIDPSLVCSDCGFIAKSRSGLGTHRRRHES